MHIGIDLMGGHVFPVDLFQSVLEALQIYPNHTFSVFLSQQAYDAVKSKYNLSLIPLKRVQFNLAEDVIDEDDEPLVVFRIKKKSSLLMAIQALQKNEIDALISAGNTSLLVIAARHFLHTLKEITKPALLTTLPTNKGHALMTDAGANILCRFTQLFQFALMAIGYHRAYFSSKDVLNIGLLNIGSEMTKGDRELRRTYDYLKERFQESQWINQIHFLGNIEPEEFFFKSPDILLCSGMLGNIFLKASEGACRFILTQLTERLGLDRTTLQPISQMVDYDAYSGALMIGIDRILIKCHGKSNYKNILKAIHYAITLKERAIIDELHEKSKMWKAN